MECNHAVFQAMGEQGRLGKRPEHDQEGAWLRYYEAAEPPWWEQYEC